MHSLGSTICIVCIGLNHSDNCLKHSPVSVFDFDGVDDGFRPQRDLVVRIYCREVVPINREHIWLVKVVGLSDIFAILIRCIVPFTPHTLVRGTSGRAQQ